MRFEKTTYNNMPFWGILSLASLLSIAMPFDSHAQTDTSFWFGAPRADSAYEANYPIQLKFASYSAAANITITQPANPSFSPLHLSLNKYSSGSVDLTSLKGMVETPTNFGMNYGYGLKITSTAKISAYYVLGLSKNVELFSLKGNNAVGNHFIIAGQTSFSNDSSISPQPKNGFVILATSDSTNVTIKLKSADENGHLAGSSFVIQLNKGQTYCTIAKGFVLGSHLGGSEVSSDRPVTVTIYDDLIGPPSTSTYDMVGDQIVAEETNGNEYVVIRGNLQYNMNPINLPPLVSPQDFYYIWTLHDSTSLYINGNFVGIIPKRGQCYPGGLADPNTTAYIKTNYPVYVYQVTGYGGKMASTCVPYIHCTGSNEVSFLRNTNESVQLQILCKTSAIKGFMLNGSKGVISPSLFSGVVGTNGAWSYARIDSTNLPAINQSIGTQQATVISNNTGLFHVAFLNGSDSTGSGIGYFSNYVSSDAQASYQGTICTGDTLHLLASAPLDNTSFYWTGPKGFSNSLQNPTIPYIGTLNNGEYFLYATMAGCDAKVDSIAINIHPIPTISITKNDTICYGTPTQINVDLTNGQQPWSMDYFNGSSRTTANNISMNRFSFPAIDTVNGQYSVYSITDANNCVWSMGGTPVASTHITVKSLPTVNIPSFYDTVCRENSLIVQMRLTGLAPWQMIVNDQSKDVAINNIYSSPFGLQLSTGSKTHYTIKSLTDGNGCSAKQPLSTFDINVFPTPVATIKLSRTDICVGDTVVISDQSALLGNQINYRYWDLGDGTFGSLSQSFTHRFMNIGINTIQLAITGPNGCTSDTALGWVVVEPLPRPILKDVSAICEKQLSLFTDESIANAGPPAYSILDYGDGSKKDTSQNGNYQHTFSKWGKYVANLFSVSAKGCKNDSTFPIIVYQIPKVGFILPEKCSKSSMVKFVDTSYVPNDNGLSFNWDFNATKIRPGPTSTSSPLNASITGNYPRDITYYIKDSVTSQNGCAASLTKPFLLKSIPTASYNVINNGDICSGQQVAILNTTYLTSGKMTKVLIWWDSIGYPNSIFSDTTPYRNKEYDSIYPTVTQQPYASYTLTLAAFSNNGCSDTTSQTIQIFPNPHISEHPIKPVCNYNGPISFDGIKETTGAVGYFTFTGQGILNTGQFDPSSLLPGTYPIQVSFTNSFSNCSDTGKTFNVTVIPPPVAYFKVLPDTNVCVEAPVFFVDKSTTGNKVQTWLWDLAGVASNDENPTRTFSKTEAGFQNIDLTVIDSINCLSKPYEATVFVNSKPTVDLRGPYYVSENGVLPMRPQDNFGRYFTPDSTSSSLTYLWTSPDSLFTRYLNDTTLLVPDLELPEKTDFANYTLTIGLKDVQYCTASGNVKVQVEHYLDIPNVFSPNNDGVNETWVIPHIKDFPLATIDIFDRGGQKVYSASSYNNDWKGTYNGNPLPIGTYYYVINPHNKKHGWSGSVTILR